MVYTLVASPISTCSKRVAIVLHEKKVPFQFKPIDLSKGEHKTPEFLAKQPFGQVPYLEDDDFTLTESRAISRYIATKHADQGTPLIPGTDAKSLARLDEAISYEANNFDTFAARAIYEGVFKKMMTGAEGDKDIVKGLINQLSAKLAVYETILSKQKYLAGDSITLADLYHLPYGSLLPYLGLDTLDNESRPNVARWWKELQARPSWQAVKDGVKAVESY
ncbi:glutathione S-transferase [Pterulicium gracile]|uniref:glutathione transferase n=1 Tax=Pterulicium gracile TaxID=1884261 RepID=A0A5C3QKW0_9AGAR|nr:glutathione S-transferase [Pterula gracilis]